MVVSLRKWLTRLKYAVLFLLFSCVLSYLFRHYAEWIEPRQPYREPKGHAVKVDGEPVRDATVSVTERLKFFYWYGE